MSKEVNLIRIVDGQKVGRKFPHDQAVKLVSYEPQNESAKYFLPDNMELKSGKIVTKKKNVDNG